MLTRVLPILPIKEQQPRFLDTRWEAANSLHSALLEPCDGTLWRHPCSFHPPLQTALAPIGGSDQIYIHLELPTVQMDLRTYILPPVQTAKYWAGFLLRISTGSLPWWPTKNPEFQLGFCAALAPFCNVAAIVPIILNVHYLFSGSTKQSGPTSS